MVRRPWPHMVLFLAMASLWSLPAAAAPKADKKADAPTITVEAEGTVTSVPDLATLNLEVETQAPKAQEAAQENAGKAKQMLAALKEILPPDEKVKTLGYRLNPVRAPQEKTGPLVIKAYQAVHRFQVRIKDPARLAAVIDTALASGANEVSGPYWEHSRLAELQRAAAVAALQKAREMAAALAQASGLKIKEVETIRTGETLPQPRALSAGVHLAKSAAATPIEAGEEEIRAKVWAMYGLTP
jgi:uncharacterized protein